MRTVLAATAALALLASGCADNESAPPSDSSMVADASTIDWSDCGELECAVVDVPLDHAVPDGDTITIDLNRAQATSSADRIGVLLVNPGGPGGSGTSLARQLAGSSPRLAEVFDIVGWDPRGVGPGAELQCDAALVTFYRLDNTPDTPAEATDLDDAAAAAAGACAFAASALLPHIGTADVADDMDLIRQALGEDEISFLGFSYGTMLGLVYAERHGEHLRAAVLDGILDPTFTLEEWLTSQAVATEAALDLILEDCDGCPAQGLDSLVELMQAADRGELMSGDAVVGPSDVSRAGIVATYDPSLHDRLRTAVRDALEGDAADLLELSNTFLNLASFDVYTAVSCVDNDRPRTTADYDAFVERISADAPILGAPIANELRPCAGWPVDPIPPISSLSAADAPPMLIVGNTGDSATPYADAVAVADRLDRATLLTYVGEGHTSYQEGSSCVDDAVERYLRELVLPAPDLVCN